MKKKIEVKNRWTGEVIGSGEFETVREFVEKNKFKLSRAELSGADLSGAELSGANLSRTKLSGADLSGAELSGAKLYGAKLYGAKKYCNSHDFTQEIICRQPIKTFTKKEWSIIGKIFTHRICWDDIREDYGRVALSVAKKLAKAGFDEYLEVLKD